MVQRKRIHILFPPLNISLHFLLGTVNNFLIRRIYGFTVDEFWYVLLFIRGESERMGDNKQMKAKNVCLI